LPSELQQKRAVEKNCAAVFERWGYAEAQTPNFERFDVLEMGLGDAVIAETFLFRRSPRHPNSRCGRR